MDILKISNLIKSKRREKGMTQEQLASKLNVTEKAISRWETGRGTPDISLLISLPNELDLDVSELLNGEEDSIKNVIEYEEERQNIKIKKHVLYQLLFILYFCFYIYYI